MRIRSILLALSLLLAAPLARADEDEQARDVARRYAEEGIAAHDHGDYDAAVQSFTKAYRVLGAPTVGIRLARSLVKLGRLVEAAKAYQSVIGTPVKKSDPPVFAQAVTEATAELSGLTPRIPTLALTVASGVTSPMLDGSPVSASMLGKPTPIDPGSHRLSGLGATPEVLVLHEGEHRSRVLLVAAQASPPPPPAVPGPSFRRIAGISSAGLAGASLVVGVFGSITVKSLRTDPELEALRYRYSDSADVCASAAAEGDLKGRSLCSRANTAETLQVVFYPAALVFAGVGTYLLLTSSKGSSTPPPQVQLLPHIGPHTGGLDVTGTF